jgi:hypothetical protein
MSRGINNATDVVSRSEANSSVGHSNHVDKKASRYDFFPLAVALYFSTLPLALCASITNTFLRRLQLAYTGK